MLVLVIECTHKALTLGENFFSAIITAIVALLGVIGQFIIGVRSNKLVLKSISENHKMKSRIEFYRPLSILITQILTFYTMHSDFDFFPDKYNNVGYLEELKELQHIYLKICKWYSENIFNMYPEQEELDQNIFRLHNHMSSVIAVNKAIPKSWRGLQEYRKEDIILLINDIVKRINKLCY